MQVCPHHLNVHFYPEVEALEVFQPASAFTICSQHLNAMPPTKQLGCRQPCCSCLVSSTQRHMPPPWCLHHYSHIAAGNALPATLQATKPTVHCATCSNACTANHNASLQGSNEHALTWRAHCLPARSSLTWLARDHGLCTTVEPRYSTHVYTAIL